MAVKIYKGTSKDIEAKNYAAELFDVTYTNAVIATWEENWHDDSDFAAMVWDAEEGRVRQVQYATTRGWTYANSAEVDATEDVLAAAREDVIRRWAERYVEDAERAAEKPSVGRRVRSLTTRGKAKGLTGEITRIIESSYDRGGHVALVEGEKDGQPASAWVNVDRLELLDTVEIISEREALVRVEDRLSRQGLVSCYRALSWTI